MTFLDSVGPSLRLLRKRAGMTQRKLAGISGVSKNLLSNWETGATQPSMESLAKVFEALDVDLLDFHNTMRLLSGRPAQETPKSASLPPALYNEGTDHLVLLLDKAPEIALWFLQLLGTLQDPPVREALLRSISREEGDG